MDYVGIDYINKTVNENANILFDAICIEVVKRNKVLFDRVVDIAKIHTDIMINDTKESDKKRDVLLRLEPTWKAIKEKLDSIEMLPF